ncbi:MAG: tRNA-binding protein [Bacteroidetes bacterium GWF2_41_31]|nr:MAG: tRNA-binding protein [Bacteroidetes bacterium GWF2_41_31]OFZ10192.1 MAG: tRNA-binding protein [Bacteroidetes bacterium RIFOXYB12_FULL_41_6]
MKQISWNEFEQVELRIGTIIEVMDFPGARKPAFKLIVDFGKEIGIKKSSAQITEIYTKEELLNKQVIGVVNFLPKQIGPFISECLITGFANETGAIVLAVPDKKVPDGAKLM